MIAAMKNIARLCLAALLSASAAFASDAVAPDRDGPSVDILGTLELRLESGARFRPARLVALEPGGAVGLSIRNPVRQRDEDRIPLEVLPVIGGVFEPTANIEFAAAPRVGAAWRVGEALVIGSEDGAAALTEGVRRVVVANRGLSFHLPAGFTAGAAFPGDAPPISDRLRIGRVHRAGDALLVIVDPSLVDPEG